LTWHHDCCGALSFRVEHNLSMIGPPTQAGFFVALLHPEHLIRPR
jgi:hypothetical protein